LKNLMTNPKLFPEFLLWFSSCLILLVNSFDETCF
jgi:hypothetical protein